ncbi:MAG: CDP-glycerol glycerophosphotransferase family protein [Colwellia sp.]
MKILSNKYSSHWGLSGETLPWVNRLYRKIKNHTVKYRVKGGGRRILLVAHNYMMLKKMMEVVDIFEGNPDFRWSCTVVAAPDDSKELIQDIKNTGCTFVPPYHASIQLWDLILVADHHVTHHFNCTIPTLIIEHGMGDSKLISNSTERYYYARCNTLNKKNFPVYSCMFESSERRKEEAISDIPALKDRISVVGHIELDSIISMGKDRLKLRHQFGYSEDDIVVLISSSHGDGSLMDSIGHDLIAEALTLPHEYKFILTSHFLSWNKNKNNELSPGESLLRYESDRVRVLRPESDFLTHTVLSDVCISDFTSGALYFAVLNRPVIFIPFPDGVISEKSPIWRLYNEAPRINKVEDLHSIIKSLMIKYPKEILKSCSSDLLTYPGEAKERMKREIYRLLKLTNKV